MNAALIIITMGFTIYAITYYIIFTIKEVQYFHLYFYTALY